MTDIIAIGEALIDNYPDGKRIGGAPLNLAVTAKLLGLNTAILTCLGYDADAKRIQEFLKERGITPFIQHTRKKTGVVSVHVSGDKHEFLITKDVAYDYIAMQPGLLSKVLASKTLTFGTLAQRSPMSRKTIQQIIRKHDGIKYYDVNIRKGLNWKPIVKATLPSTTILKLNTDEFSAFQEEFHADLVYHLFHHYAIQQILVTHGSKGAELYFRDGRTFSASPSKRKVVDTVGAGDAFSAGYLYALFKDLPPQEALQTAVEIGAAVTEIAGAQPKTLAKRRKFVAT